MVLKLTTMYFIYKDEKDNKFKILNWGDSNDGTYYKLKNLLGLDLHGQFGRLDYAQIWTDFYNKLFDRKTLRIKLGL